MENREIPSGWIETTLGEVAVKITKGTTPTTIGSNFVEEGIKFFRSECIKENKYLDKSLLKYIDEETHLRMNRSQLEENDILFSMAGIFLGKTGIVKKEDIPGNINQAIAIIRLNDKIVNFNFVYYFLNIKEIVAYVNNSSGQSAQPNINLKQIGEISITIPSLAEQKAIAAVLSSLDEKIELLEEENKTLETLAQTIFTEWFVNFNFPGRMGEQCSESGTTSPGATGEMEDSELGEIPKGWRVGKLGELVLKLSKGTTPKQSGDENKIISFLKVKDITDSGNILLDTVEKIAEQVHKSSLSRSILEEKDILFSIAGTIGRVAIVPKHFHNSNCNQAIAFIRLLDKELFLEYIHLWIRTDKVKNEINASIVQGVQANVSLTVLGNLKLLLPTESVLKTWKEIIEPIYSKIMNNNEQIQALKTTRDTLLPKLMSGEIRVEGFGE